MLRVNSYDKARPAPSGFPTQIKYGGAYWNMTLSKEDLAGDPMNILKTKAVMYVSFVDSSA